MREFSVPKAPVKVSVEDEVPAEVSALVVPIVEKLADLIPAWCEELRIKWTADLDHIAQVNVSERYRWAVITLSGMWLDLTSDRRIHTLVHEMIHMHLSPLSGKARELVSDELPDKLIVDATEAVVCEITDLISRLKGITTFRRGE